MTEAGATIPRTVWMLWQQGLAQAPFLVHRCVDSWRRENPGWRVVVLDQDNLGHYSSLDLSHPHLARLSPTKQSNLVRLHLLAEHGGVWADATTLCMQPLDQWLDEHARSGFFAFRAPGPDRLLSTWFLASEANGPIVRKLAARYAAFFTENSFSAPGRLRTRITGWLETRLNRSTRTTRHWFSPLITKLLRVYPYFIFHYMFERLIATDAECRSIWQRTTPIDAGAPHDIQTAGLLTPLSEEMKLRIDQRRTPVYKLTWRYDQQSYSMDSVLGYLLEGRHQAPSAGLLPT